MLKVLLFASICIEQSIYDALYSIIGNGTDAHIDSSLGTIMVMTRRPITTTTISKPKVFGIYFPTESNDSPLLFAPVIKTYIY